VDAMPQNELGNQTRELFKSQYGEMNNADKFGQWVDKTLNDTTQTLTGTQAPAPVSANSSVADGAAKVQNGPGATTTPLSNEAGLGGEQHFVNASDMPPDVPLDTAQTEMGGVWQDGMAKSSVEPVKPLTVDANLEGMTQQQITELPPIDGSAGDLSTSFAQSDISGAVQGPPDLTGLGAATKEGISAGTKPITSAVATETGKVAAGEVTKTATGAVINESTKAVTGEVVKGATSTAAQNLASTAAANGVKGVATSATASVASGAASMGAGIAGGLAGGAIGEAIGGKTGGKVGSALGSALAAGMMLGPWGAVAALAISGIMELF